MGRGLVQAAAQALRHQMQARRLWVGAQVQPVTIGPGIDFQAEACFINVEDILDATAGQGRLKFINERSEGEEIEIHAPQVVRS